MSYGDLHGTTPPPLSPSVAHHTARGVLSPRVVWCDLRR